MEDREHLAAVMAEVAASLEAPIELDTALLQLTTATVETVPSAVAASISLTVDGEGIQTLAPTHDWVHSVDALQYQLRQGPGFEVTAHETPILEVDEMGLDPRWPDYGPKAADLGVGSQIAFGLHAGPGQHGALNIYARPHAFDHDSRYLGELFAIQVGLALDWTRHEETLHEALATRKVIGQALGMVMQQYQLDEDSAFRYLVRVSQNANIKLHHIAEDLVAQANQRHSRAGDG